MKHLIALAAIIEQTGIAKTGKSLFLLTMPAKAQNAVMIRGPQSGDPIDWEQPGVIDTEFLLVLRHQDEITAYNNCLLLSAALTMRRVTLSNGMYVIRCEPKTMPISYPRSEADTLEWAVRFAITWGDANSKASAG